MSATVRKLVEHIIEKAHKKHIISGQQKLLLCKDSAYFALLLLLVINVREGKRSGTHRDGNGDGGTDNRFTWMANRYRYQTHPERPRRNMRQRPRSATERRVYPSRHMYDFVERESDMEHRTLFTAHNGAPQVK